MKRRPASVGRRFACPAAHIAGMTSITRRQPVGTPVGGQFASTAHPESNVSLSRPAVHAGFAESRLRDLDLAGRLDSEQIAEVTARLNESLDFSDRNIEAVADTIHERDFGVTATDERSVRNLRDELHALGRTAEAEALSRVANVSARAREEHDTFLSHEEFEALQPDGTTEPVPASDPRLQAGEVFDKIADGHGTVFHRRRPGTYPGTPYAMRFQANRPLSDDEKNQFAGLAGYAYRKTVAGESLGFPDSDSPYSFIVDADTTKSRRDDLGQAMGDFEEALPGLIQEGSDIRTTNRSGPIGSRLIEGFNDPDLKFEVYYDDVWEPQR